MKPFKTTLFSLILFSFLLFPLATVYAQTEELQNFGKAAYGDEIEKVSREQGPIYIAGKIVKIFLGVIGITMVILMVFGGYLWMTAGGNEEKITKAKKIIGNAIIGLIIVIMAYGISYFVIQQLSIAAGTPRTP